METKKVDLYKEFGVKKPENATGYLTCYIQGKNECTIDTIRPAMLVIPGGAYRFVSAREGEAVALKYIVNGFNSFMLDYSVSPVSYPYQLLEGVMAMLYIKKHADEFNVDTKHIAAVGFSAGGHLAATLATIWNEKEIKDILGEQVEEARPDAVVLSYPVITTGDFVQIDSILNVTGGDKSLNDKLSAEKRVNENSSPAFIWSTQEDKCVPCENAFYMAMAYRKYNVPFEFHVFTNGFHGLSLATTETGYINDNVAQWFDLSINWLKERDFIIRNREN